MAAGELAPSLPGETMAEKKYKLREHPEMIKFGGWPPPVEAWQPAQGDVPRKIKPDSVNALIFHSARLINAPVLGFRLPVPPGVPLRRVLEIRVDDFQGHSFVTLLDTKLCAANFPQRIIDSMYGKDGFSLDIIGEMEI